MEPQELNDLKYFFFDLDKTLWNWDDTVIGAEDLIDSLRESGKQVYFHTDNTLLTRKEYAKKLTSMGIPAEKEDVLTSGHVAARHLAAKNVTEAYVIGESGLMEELRQEDVQISQDADTVIAGFDRQFNYSKLKRAMDIAGKEGEIIVCSSEKTFRTSKREVPHQGPFNQALKEFGDVKLVGKPSEVFREVFEDYFDYLPNLSLFIGDRLEDIETGNTLGMNTAAVMSGEIDREKLEKAEDIQKPDYGLSSLHKLRRRVL